jgi:prepilin-type N-terminal cleavage/methylation domain-containing protein
MGSVMRRKYQRSRLVEIIGIILKSNRSKSQQLNKQHYQAGFTIIESLVAIVVLAILMSAIAPVIVLSTATRIQARRVELATQAAKSYAEGVAAGNVDLPSDTIGAVPTKLDDLYCFDVDGGKCGENLEKQLSTKDLRVQGYRIGTGSSEDAKKNGSTLGLRVYRNDALVGGGTLQRSDAKSTDPSKQKVTQSTFTGGLGDKTKPLVEMTTDIAPRSTDNYKSLCNRLQSTDINSNSCK